MAHATAHCILFLGALAVGRHIGFFKATDVAHATIGFQLFLALRPSADRQIRRATAVAHAIARCEFFLGTLAFDRQIKFLQS